MKDEFHPAARSQSAQITGNGCKGMTQLALTSAAPPTPPTLSFRAALIRKATCLFFLRLNTQSAPLNLSSFFLNERIPSLVMTHSFHLHPLLSYTLPLSGRVYNSIGLDSMQQCKKKQTADTQMYALTIPAQVCPICIILTMCSNAR